MSKRIFLVEDDVSLLEIAKYQLTAANYKVDSFTKGEDAWNCFQENKPDFILTDLILDGNMNGDELLKRVMGQDKSFPVILMTANGTIDSAVECVRMGAWNYLTKPFHWDDMLNQIEKALNYNSIQSENVKLKKIVGSYEGYEKIIGNSTAILKVKKQLIGIASSDAPILLQGESGTGKELVAKSIHLNGKRKNKPFIAVNCGAIVKELAESELFGHAKGAFTGATQSRKGHFGEAEGGTIFLDEIGELPLNLQVKLLRVLQESEITQVGESKSIPIDVRVITATNLDLENAIQCGEFREDLFYRISVLPLQLPPLRKRVEDIEMLCSLFLEKEGKLKSSLSPDLISRLKSYEWKGNIRELQNFITRLVALNPEIDHFQESHIPNGDLVLKCKEQIPYEIPEKGINLDAHMNDLIKSALAKCEGNQSKAARLLGITRSTLIYRMQKL
jgi:DNA-binding NtrC family response regulator